MDKVILHCDLNCFYASVEMLYNPSLKNVPMAVAGDPQNRHGIILTKNVLAKQMGVKTGEPIWQAKQKCPDLTVVSPDYDSYMYFSRRVKDLYYEYTDKIESFGLDEAWLDITSSISLFGSTEKIVKDILKRVKEEIGLTLSIGVSNNKIYSKLGSDLAIEDSYYVIHKPEEIYSLPACDLLYVGSHTYEKIKRYGLYTIGDIANTSAKYMKELLGKMGETLYYFSKGYDFSPVKKYLEDNDEIKSIGNSTTTKRDLYDIDDVKLVLTVLCDSVASRCKDHGFYFKTVHLSLRNKKLECFSVQKTLSENTDLSIDLFKTALSLFETNCDFTIPYRSIGVSVSHLSYKKENTYMSLFEEPNYSLKEKKMEEALEKIRRRFGYHSVSTLRLKEDENLSSFDPKSENVVYPVSFFR